MLVLVCQRRGGGRTAGGTAAGALTEAGPLLCLYPIHPIIFRSMSVSRSSILFSFSCESSFGGLGFSCFCSFSSSFSSGFGLFGFGLFGFGLFGFGFSGFGLGSGEGSSSFGGFGTGGSGGKGERERVHGGGSGGGGGGPGGVGGIIPEGRCPAIHVLAGRGALNEVGK